MREVGHFRSDTARESFLDVYRECLAALPPYAESSDVSTGFGTVRVYRFDGPARARPVVLLPGRNASTPMWAANLPALLRHRTVFAVDLLGEPGLSVQRLPLNGSEDQAHWMGDVLAGLGLQSAHLMGVSFGGWMACNYAIRQPGRVASVTLLDPVMTFARIPIRTMLVVAPMGVPGVPDALRRRILRWISGGADVDESVPEARLISAASRDFMVRLPMPTLFTDDQLRTLDVPVLALVAGRSVIHDAEDAAVRARNLLPRGEVELWPEASHAISGECADEIAERAHRFWDHVDG